MADIIDLLGGPSRVAEDLGLKRHTVVSNWRRRGFPDSAKWKLLRLAKEKGLPMTDVLPALGMSSLDDETNIVTGCDAVKGSGDTPALSDTTADRRRRRLTPNEAA